MIEPGGMRIILQQGSFVFNKCKKLRDDTFLGFSYNKRKLYFCVSFLVQFSQIYPGKGNNLNKTGQMYN